MSTNDLNHRLERLTKVLLDEPQHRRLDRALSRADHKLDRAGRRAEKREQRRNRPGQDDSMFGGAVMLVVAVTCAVLGIVDPHRFWLIFVGLGLGLGGGKQIERALRRRRLEGPAPEAVKAPVPVDRAEALCDQLLKELKDSPDAVRDFLGKPEATVEAIRAASSPSAAS